MLGKNAYRYKSWLYKGKELNENDICYQAVNTGSTVGYYDFDYTYWKLNGINLGWEPQTLYYDFEMLKSFSDKLYKNAYVFICIEEFKLLVDHYPDSANYKYYFCLNKKEIYNYKKSTAFVLKTIPCFLLKSLFLQETKQFFHTLSNQLIFIDYDNSLEHDRYWSDFYMNVWKQEFGWSALKSELTKQQITNIRINLKRLEKMLQFCKQNHWNPVIIIPPFSPNLVNLIPEDILEQCLWNPMRHIMEKGYKVLDLLHDKEFEDYHLFRNALTLNEKGKQLFNYKIQKELGISDMADTKTEYEKTYTLINGVNIPWIAFGTGVIWKYTRNKMLFTKIIILQLLQSMRHKKWNRELYGNINIKKILTNAYSAGFRMFDSGRIYAHSEDSIGNTVSAYQDAFIITKCSAMDIDRAYSPDSVEGNLSVSLTNLRRSSVDLYLLHWPEKDWLSHYQQIIEEYKRGRCKAFGACNLKLEHLTTIEQAGLELPMVLQTELHPLNTKEELRKYCDKHKIQLMAHTPTARACSELVDNKIVKALMLKYKKSGVQIVLRWHFQHNIIPVVCTYQITHMSENLDIFDFELTSREMMQIDSLNCNKVILDAQGIDEPNYIFNY